jgi:hypothetical protein
LRDIDLDTDCDWCFDDAIVFLQTLGQRRKALGGLPEILIGDEFYQEFKLFKGSVTGHQCDLRSKARPESL